MLFRSGPAPKYSPRFLAWAEKHQDDANAIPALLMALQTSMGPEGKVGTWKPTLELLKKKYATHAKVDQVLRLAHTQARFA